MISSFEWVSEVYKYFLDAIHTGSCSLIWCETPDLWKITWSYGGFEWDVPLKPILSISAEQLGRAFAHLALGCHRNSLLVAE